MNILFLSLGRVQNIEDKGIYTDLLRCFRDDGHSVYIVGATERRNGNKTTLTDSGSVHTLCVRIGNITKCNLLEKGVSTLLLGNAFSKAVNKYFGKVRFDLIIYSTPPITLCSVIRKLKKRFNAKTYLLLKDIFPQNAVDLGMMRTTGIKGIVYRYFRKQEKKLYAVSDRIGCMSQANVDYILKHDPEIDPSIVGICPNSIEVRDMRLTDSEKLAMRDKYGIPADKKVLVYGGNLGKPQGIPFLIDCLRAEKDNEKAFFLIAGDGTEYGKLEAFINEEKPANVKLMKRLPKEDYEKLVASCDIGLIFLDHRFTIPNFPSRLLSYMQAGLPVLACTDPNTDIGKVITEGGFGWWCESDDAKNFTKTLKNAVPTNDKANNAFNYLKMFFDVGSQSRQILHFASTKDDES